MNALQLILSKRSYLAPIWIFTSINIMLGTWVLYIPHIKASLSLTDAEMGIALFIYALGILTSLPLVPFLSRKIGLGRVVSLSLSLFLLFFILPFISESYFFLCLSLFIIGIFSGIADVAMNAIVSNIEERDHIKIMSAAHGFFSLGAVIGSGIGSVFIWLEIPILVHIILVILFLVVTNSIGASHYFSFQEKAREHRNKSAGLRNMKPLIGLAILAFLIMVNEGAVEHWSKLFFIAQYPHLTEVLTGVGFILFSISMTIGRFFGDGLSRKLGSKELILTALLVACVGMAFVLFENYVVNFIGFGILGLGLSVLIPELFRLAGSRQDIEATKAIALVSGAGFIGFLIGPVILGAISSAYNLWLSFAFLEGLLLFAIVFSLFKQWRKS